MALATVFNPTTKQRKQITVGDPNAFAGGFKLETPLSRYTTPATDVGGGTTVDNPGAIPSSSPQEDPITKFNMAIWDMLKSAQQQGMTADQSNYAQQNKLTQQGIDMVGKQQTLTGLPMTPGAETGALEDVGRMNQPAITNLADQMKLRNTTLTNFESLLEKAKTLGEDIIKVNPSPKVIDGYKQYLINGGDIKNIDKDVLGKVISGMSAEEWTTAKSAATEDKHSPIYYEWKDAQASGYKGNLNQYMSEDANRKLKASGGGGGKLTMSEQEQLDARNVASQLETVRGQDGYMNPADYKLAKGRWVQAGYTAASFDSRFSNYVNPAHPQDYYNSGKKSPEDSSNPFLNY